MDWMAEPLQNRIHGVGQITQAVDQGPVEIEDHQLSVDFWYPFAVETISNRISSAADHPV